MDAKASPIDPWGEELYPCETNQDCSRNGTLLRGVCVSNTGLAGQVFVNPEQKFCICNHKHNFVGPMCEIETGMTSTFRSIRVAVLLIEGIVLFYGLLALYQARKYRILRANPLWVSMGLTLLSTFSHFIWNIAFILSSIGNLSMKAQEGIDIVFEVAVPVTTFFTLIVALLVSLVWLEVLRARKTSYLINGKIRIRTQQLVLFIGLAILSPVVVFYFQGRSAEAFFATMPFLFLITIAYIRVLYSVNRLYDRMNDIENGPFSENSLELSTTTAPRISLDRRKNDNNNMKKKKRENNNKTASVPGSTISKKPKEISSSHSSSSEESHSAIPQKMLSCCGWFVSSVQETEDESEDDNEVDGDGGDGTHPTNRKRRGRQHKSVGLTFTNSQSAIVMETSFASRGGDDDSDGLSSVSTISRNKKYYNNKTRPPKIKEGEEFVSAASMAEEQLGRNNRRRNPSFFMSRRMAKKKNQSSLLQSLQNISYAGSAMNIGLALIMAGGFGIFFTTKEYSGGAERGAFFLILSIGVLVINSCIIFYVRSALKSTLTYREKRKQQLVALPDSIISNIPDERSLPGGNNKSYQGSLPRGMNPDEKSSYQGSLPRWYADEKSSYQGSLPRSFQGSLPRTMQESLPRGANQDNVSDSSSGYSSAV